MRAYGAAVHQSGQIGWTVALNRLEYLRPGLNPGNSFGRACGVLYDGTHC
jgi:hypothetical protein